VAEGVACKAWRSPPRSAARHPHLPRHVRPCRSAHPSRTSEGGNTWNINQRASGNVLPEPPTVASGRSERRRDRGRPAIVGLGRCPRPVQPVTVKYVDPLPILSVMPGRYKTLALTVTSTRQAEEAHCDLPATTVWGYQVCTPGLPRDPPWEPVEVTDQQLPTTQHLLPVDHTLPDTMHPSLTSGISRTATAGCAGGLRRRTRRLVHARPDPVRRRAPGVRTNVYRTRTRRPRDSGTTTTRAARPG
jgi:hypothetical protein